jgi:hypothetical protein
MKKQLIKIMVLSITCLTLSIGAKAQQYEGGVEENYEEEAVDNAMDYYPENELDSTIIHQFGTYIYYQAEEGPRYNGSIIYPKGYRNRSTNENNGSAIGGIPDPLPDTPIDSNLYVLLFAALCYGYYKRKRLMKIA